MEDFIRFFIILHDAKALLIDHAYISSFYKKSVKAFHGGKDAIRLQLAFLVKHADHSAHTIIRCDYLLKDPSFI